MSAHAEARPAFAALGSDIRRFVTLTRTLAVAEFKLRYLDSALSYLWTLAYPLAFFAVLYLVFTRVGGFDRNVEHYPLYLLTSIVLWLYFAEATATSVRCLVQREDLLRKVPIPHMAIPLSVVLRSLMDLSMNLVAVFVFLFASGVTPRVSWLQLPLLMLAVSIFVTGFALLLSALYVRYRDVDQIWLLLRQALFYGSPIFYVASALPDSVEKTALANPLAAVFTQARHALIDPDAPTAAAALGGNTRLLIPLGITVAVFALGLWAFRRESPRVAENL